MAMHNNLQPAPALTAAPLPPTGAGGIHCLVTTRTRTWSIPDASAWLVTSLDKPGEAVWSITASRSELLTRIECTLA